MPSSGINVGTTFNTQPAGNVQASLLDNNFSQLFNAYNSLLSPANFYSDSSGAPNVIAISVPTPLVVSYAAGLPLQILVANTTTGATTINVNGLGAVPLVYPNGGGALTTGQIQAGAIIPVMYDGTHFQYLGSIGSSSQPVSGSSTLTGTGFATPVPTFTLQYTIFGQLVIASISAAVGTSNANSFTLTGVPALLQPPSVKQLVSIYAITDNSGPPFGSGGLIIQSASSTWQVVISGNTFGWSTSGGKGLGLASASQSFAFLVV